MKTKITRRDLFTSILGKIKTQDKKDPLFEKYSRKIFKPRVYQKNIDESSNELDRVTPVTSGLETYSGPWTTLQALHVIKRTGFGHKKSEVDAIAGMTFDTALNTVLNVDATPPSPPVKIGRAHV